MGGDVSIRGGPAPWRAVVAVAATYVFFLLFAQFGLLDTLRAELVDAQRVQAAMAAMGLAGLVGSLLTGLWLRRLAPQRAVPAGLLACAVVALAAPAAHGLPALLLLSGGTGLATAFLTISLATGLRDWLPAPRFGLLIGLGTGLAYAISNIPSLFFAAPAVRAVVPGLLCAAAGLLFLRTGPGRADKEAPATGGLAPFDVGARGVAGAVLAFVALVALDSAAFAVIQENPALTLAAWGRANGRLVPGLIHALAAVAAGWLIDRAGFRRLLGFAYVLFAIALGAITRGEHLGGWLYVAAVSFYSTALVAFPGLRRDGVAPRWRATLVYGIGGWLGSALGVGGAQQLHRLPLSLLLLAGAVLALGALVRARGAARALAGVGLGAAIGLLVFGVSRAVPAQGDLVTRGRAVYVREGCISCHSQFVRPQPRDEEWWGPARSYDRNERPPLIGNRRLGPDLDNVGNRRFANWNVLHLQQPDVVSPGSRMPSYAHLFAPGNPDGDALAAYLSSLGSSTLVQRVANIAAVPGPAGVEKGSARRGRKIYSVRCTGCHGKDGRGDGPLAGQLPWPALNLRKGPLFSLGGQPVDAQRVARLIKFGWTGTPMAGHEYLPDADLADVTAYVLSLARPSR